MTPGVLSVTFIRMAGPDAAMLTTAGQIRRRGKTWLADRRASFRTGDKSPKFHMRFTRVSMIDFSSER